MNDKLYLKQYKLQSKSKTSSQFLREFLQPQRKVHANYYAIPQSHVFGGTLNGNAAYVLNFSFFFFKTKGKDLKQNK